MYSYPLAVRVCVWFFFNLLCAWEGGRSRKVNCSGILCTSRADEQVTSAALALIPGTTSSSGAPPI